MTSDFRRARRVDHLISSVKVIGTSLAAASALAARTVARQVAVVRRPAGAMRSHLRACRYTLEVLEHLKKWPGRDFTYARDARFKMPALSAICAQICAIERFWRS